MAQIYASLCAGEAALSAARCGDSSRASSLFHMGRLANPLCGAGEAGRAEALEFLLRRGAPWSVRDASGRSPMLCAINSGSLSCVQILVEFGADWSSDGDGSLLVIEAVWSGQVDILRYLVEKDGRSLYAKDYNGQTPLMAAISTNNRAMLDWICAHIDFEPEQMTIEAVAWGEWNGVLCHFEMDDESRKAACLRLLSFACDKLSGEMRSLWVPCLHSLLRGWTALVSSFPVVNEIVRDLLSQASKLLGNPVLDWNVERSWMALMVVLVGDESMIGCRRGLYGFPNPEWILKWVGLENEDLVFSLFQVFGFIAMTRDGLVRTAMAGRVNALRRLHEVTPIPDKMIRKALMLVGKKEFEILRRVFGDAGIVDPQTRVSLPLRLLGAKDISFLEVGFYEAVGDALKRAGAPDKVDLIYWSGWSPCVRRVVESSARGFQLSSVQLFECVRADGFNLS